MYSFLISIFFKVAGGIIQSLKINLYNNNLGTLCPLSGSVMVVADMPKVLCLGL